MIADSFSHYFPKLAMIMETARAADTPGSGSTRAFNCGTAALERLLQARQSADPAVSREHFGSRDLWFYVTFILPRAIILPGNPGTTAPRHAQASQDTPVPPGAAATPA